MAENENGSYARGLIQSPELNTEGKPEQTAVKDAGMAKEIVQTLIAANRMRQIVNSRIAAKYNAERPYQTEKLEAEGLSWRSNFTTKPLAQMVEKVFPRFVEAVSGLRYLTNSALDDRWENSVEKTDKFRCGVTKLFRSRKGWRNLVEDIALENGMFGSTLALWLDEFSWFPKHFKQDAVFLSDGCKQMPSSAQVFAVKETFLPHELFEMVKDRSAAEAAGWNIKNTMEAINEASPAQLRQNLNNSGTLDMWYQNAQRELTVGASYMAGASVVVVYSLFAQEVTGKVSHYRLGNAGLNELFSKENRFDSMDECVTFFAYQKGNGTMAGSKGIGREAYELAAMMDRIRNEVVDRSILSGKTMIQGDIKNIHRFKMSIVGATCIVPTGWNVLEQKIDGNVEPFLKLDSYFTGLSDQLIGSVSPKVLEGERVTAAQVNLFAAREEEGKDTRITRFLEFFTDMVGTMQRRACSKDTQDEDAKKFQENMLKIMSREELDELAKEPVAGTVRDLTPVQRQLIVSLASEKKGNPLYNQRQLETEDLTARIDQEFADRVLLPVNDPTEQAEQQRLQQMELALLSAGQPVPVSPRDNHEIHMSILMPVLEKIGAALHAGDAGTEVFEATVAHLTEHLHNAQAQGVSKDVTKPVEEFIKKAMPVIAQLHAVDQQAEQLHNQSQAVDAGEQPPQQ